MHTHKYIYTFIHVYMCTYMYTYTYVCIHLCIFEMHKYNVCICTYIYMCTYACILTVIKTYMPLAILQAVMAVTTTTADYCWLLLMDGPSESLFLCDLLVLQHNVAPLQVPIEALFGGVGGDLLDPRFAPLVASHFLALRARRVGPLHHAGDPMQKRLKVLHIY